MPRLIQLNHHERNDDSAMHIGGRLADRAAETGEARARAWPPSPLNEWTHLEARRSFRRMAPTETQAAATGPRGETGAGAAKGRRVDRRVTGVRGRVIGQHILGAERRINVEAGHVTVKTGPGLSVALWLGGPTLGWLLRGSTGCNYSLCHDLYDADVLDDEARLREGASWVSPGGDVRVHHAGGLLTIEREAHLSVPSLACPVLEQVRHARVTIGLSPDLSRVGDIRVHETATPAITCLPFNLVAWRKLWPRVDLICDCTVTHEPGPEED